MKRDLPAAIIISLALHAVLLGALHLAVLPTGRDAAFANAGEGATAGGGAAPIRVVMADRRPPGSAARPGGGGRADGTDDPGRAEGGGGAGTAGDADRAVAKRLPRAPEAAAMDVPRGARVTGEAPAANADASTEPSAGREPSGDPGAGDEMSGDEVSGVAPAQGLPAGKGAAAETPSPAETRVPRPPSLAGAIDPEYPFRARRLGHEGTVAFTVLVGAGGAVLDITLEESSGHAELDEAALAAVNHASYVPGSSDSPMSLRVRVVFRLESGNRGS